MINSVITLHAVFTNYVYGLCDSDALMVFFHEKSAEKYRDLLNEEKHADFARMAPYSADRLQHNIVDMAKIAVVGPALWVQTMEKIRDNTDPETEHLLVGAGRTCHHLWIDIDMTDGAVAGFFPPHSGQQPSTTPDHHLQECQMIIDGSADSKSLAVLKLSGWL